MPKEQPITITHAVTRWTITSYTVVPGAVDPTAGTVFIDVQIDTLSDGTPVGDVQHLRHTVAPPASLALLADIGARMAAFLGAGQAAGAAYYLATRDGLYAQLQADGVIPLGAG